jgi:hypothetical protein
LCSQGYTVRSEVNGCDITAVKGDELIVVELKRSFSTDLLIQAVERQRVADSVYVGVPAHGELAGKYNKKRRGVEALLRRLELGLLLVHLPSDTDAPPLPPHEIVEVALHPVTEQKPRRKAKIRRALLKEIAERKSGDYNVGGTSKRALLTAYREKCIHLACLLDKHGPSTPAKLRAFGADAKSQPMLHRNVYGWFERDSRGVYSLRAGVRAHIAETYPGVAAHYEERAE